MGFRHQSFYLSSHKAGVAKPIVFGKPGKTLGGFSPMTFPLSSPHLLVPSHTSLFGLPETTRTIPISGICTTPDMAWLIPSSPLSLSSDFTFSMTPSLSTFFYIAAPQHSLSPSQLYVSPWHFPSSNIWKYVFSLWKLCENRDLKLFWSLIWVLVHNRYSINSCCRMNKTIIYMF